MDLHRLRTFQALSETLHFRHAAERLGITQSAVSQQIASLEKDLGAALFERIGRRVFLTAAGEVLAREAVKVLSTVSRAREAVLAVSKGNSGRLRVGASTTLGVCGFRPTHEELFEIELGEDRIIAVAAPALTGKTRRVLPGDLAGWPLVSRERGSATRTAVERALTSLGVELVPAFELPSPEAIVRAAEAALGYAFVSARAAREGIEAGRLVE